MTEGSTLKTLFDNIISKFLALLSNSISIKYNFTNRGRKANAEHNSSRVIEMYASCQALLTVKAYLRFVQELYAFNSENSNVRKAVATLFQD